MKPLISLCMIVRDEAELLSRCLDSVAAYVDETIVVDTGSTDATAAVAERCGARVLDHTWADDFSAARNVALDAANGRWVLVLDADEWIEGGCPPEELRSKLRDAHDEAFFVTMADQLDHGETRRYPLVRLFRNREDHRYAGAFHEQITPSLAARLGLDEILPDDCGLIVGHDGYGHRRRSDRQKTVRNLQLLRRQVETEPESAATRFFLIRELIPLRGGRAVPGRHLAEALELCERLQTERERLSPAIRADFTRLYAAALLAVRRQDDARRLLDDCADDSPPFEVLRADCDIALGDREALAQAVERLERCFDRPRRGSLPVLEPAIAGPLARARAAEALLGLGEIEEARRLAREATTLPGGGAAPWRAAATVERAAGQVQAALRSYMAGFEADPHDPWNWAGLGELLLQLEAHADAIQPLSNALALAPGWQDAEEALAAALLLADRAAEILERYEDADLQPLDSVGQSATLLAAAMLERDPPVRRCDAGAEESVRRILRRLAVAGRTDLLNRLQQGLSVPAGV